MRIGKSVHALVGIFILILAFISLPLSSIAAEPATAAGTGAATGTGAAAGTAGVGAATGLSTLALVGLGVVAIAVVGLGVSAIASGSNGGGTTSNH